MPYLLDLADAVRATGLPIIEVPGWRTRGQGPMRDVRGGVMHWTATPASVRPREDYPSLAVVRDGRTGLRGLLSQLGLSRSGAVVVIGAGLAYHAGTGYHPGIGASGNPRLIGVEREGTFDDWTGPQLHAYPVLMAGLTRWYRYPVGHNLSHHEWAGPRKRDIDTWPGGPTAFRARVSRVLNPPPRPAPEPTPEEDDEMKTIYAKGKDRPHIYACTLTGESAAVRHVTAAEWAVATAAGADLTIVPQKDLDALVAQAVGK